MRRALTLAVALAASTAFAASATLAASATTFATPHARFADSSRTNPVIRSASAETQLAKFLTMIDAHYVGHPIFGKMTVDIDTPMRNEAALHAYARAASAPGSAYYRHFLTPSQIASAFGTPAAQYASSVKYFASFGLAVKQWTPKTMITVTGSSANLERALGMRFGSYAAVDRVTGQAHPFVAPASSIALSSAIGTVNIRGLATANLRRNDSFVGGPSVPVSGSFSDARVNGATPLELARAFDYDGAYNAGFTGKGVNLGIIGTGPISFDDVPNYKAIYNVPGSSTVTLVPSSVNGDSTPPPVTGPADCTGVVSGAGLPVGLPVKDPTAGSSTEPTSTCNPEDIEAQLDTEQTSTLARDANVLFYLAYNGTGCEVEANPAGGCIGPTENEQGLLLTDDEIMQAVNDNQADILSLSYGGCEVLESATLGLTANPGGDATGTDPTLFAELAAEGIAVFVSTGDSGSAGCQRNVGGADPANVQYPASDPNVVAVGGTTTPMLPSGVLTGPITTWGSQTKSGGAEGAGLSDDFVTPPFQSAIPSVAAICTMRCVPDVVLDADPFTGAAVVYDSGPGLGGAEEEPVGGTSQAAPDMAAMWALVLSACEQKASCGGYSASNISDPVSGYTPTAAPHAFRLGNPNYLLYPLAATANATVYHQTFDDIVFGDDGVPPYAVQVASSEAAGEGANVSAYAAGLDPGSVSAGPGYDNATGLGAPFARALIKYVVGV